MRDCAPTWSRRQREAKRRRKQIVEAAHHLFLSQGFGATSIEEIAAKADVSAPTVYSAFGSKAGLLKRVVDVSLVGDDEDRPLHARAGFERATSPEIGLRERIEATAALAYEVHRRSARVLRLVAAVAGADPAVGELNTQLTVQRAETSRRFMEAIPTSAIREGLTRADAALLLDIHGGAETFARLVLDAGWSRQRYERWYVDTVFATVLVDDTPTH